MRQYATFRTQHDYAVPLLEVLAGMPGHQAAPRMIIAEIDRRYGSLIPPEQRERVPSGRDIRWANWVAWERADLIRQALMAAPAAGIWAITSSGLQWLRDNPTAIRLGASPQPRRPRVPKGQPKTVPATPTPRPTPSESEQERRALQLYRSELRSIRDSLAGRAARPTDEHLCDMVQFCYTFELYQEACDLFALVDQPATNPWLYQRTARLASVCANKRKGRP